MSKKRDQAIAKRLIELKDELGILVQQGSTQTIHYLEAHLDSIIHELHWDNPVGDTLNYYYWDALEDISRPGRFQGQPAWVPMLYYASLEGFHDDEVTMHPETSGNVFFYFENAKEVCPWQSCPLDGVIFIDEQGFVHADSYERYQEMLNETPFLEEE